VEMAIACVRESERERESMCVYARECVCVRERVCVREKKCVCVRLREGESVCVCSSLTVNTCIVGTRTCYQRHKLFVFISHVASKH